MPLRRAAKKDANQKQIEDALRAARIAFFDTSPMGNGFPDLVVLYRKRVWLLEIKDGNKPPSAQKLTPAEEKFHRQFEGCVYVVNSVDAVFELFTTTKF